MSLKLLVEEPCYDIETLVEEKNKNEEATIYIHGPYLMAEEKNKNGRVYPLHEMTKEVNRYIRDMIETRRALGELNHPTSVEINPERACHLITNLHQEGNVFIGKSKVLDTPLGRIVKSLVQEKVRLGVSSRALGKLTPSGDHNDVSDFHLLTCDVVHDPSVPTAFVDGILEAKEYVIRCNGHICEVFDKFEESLEKLPRHDVQQYLSGLIVEFIENLKKNAK